MKIAIIGATGGTGKKAVERALELGHEVIAVARRPEVIPSAERLTVRKGDVFDAASIAKAIVGAEVVISCVGPPSNVTPGSFRKGFTNVKAGMNVMAANFSPGTVMSEGIPNMIAACQQAGVKRIVMQSGINLTDGKELTVFNRFAVRIMRRIFWRAIKDKAFAEDAVRQSNLEWIIVRPSVLSYAEANGKYTAGPAARIAPLRPLPFENCADSLVRAAASEPTWVGKIVNVGR
ncbi:NAD(P)-dependent oxidoreductase [Paenibacillus senegalimassiliensis]|uniref:NAD(P)-dependent oxidoreductase n=1 Tax=Paenibacillus senegalimassiliensis TaxID=1737426 RepID=UPI00073E24FB|nr:NAD(P)H-binding protein [Paenibacillus senegalimassiliensis]